MGKLLPSGHVRTWAISVTPRAARSASAFETNMNFITRTGQHLEARVTLTPMARADALAWGDLEEPFDTLIWPIDQSDIIAANEGSPRVAGAGQLGRTLNVDGVTAGYVIPKGAYVTHIASTGRRYTYPIASAVTASGTGTAALDLRIPLRVSPSDNDVMEIATPKLEGLVMSDTGLEYGEGFLSLPRTFTLRERG
ncbi:hypothetical protein [Oceanicaulis sp.]|uniref:hypothetical protein n=1 Tax=Oceanicaulis sp. TaxID=1924941 RepID=UPI003D271E8C